MRQDVESAIHGLQHQQVKPLAGIVPYSEYWLVDAGEYVGTIQIRHKPSGRYPQIKSHVYYEIRPSRRGLGYGTHILKLGLARARALGIRVLLVTCSADNIGSQKVIERNGGELVGEISVPDSVVPVLRYKISLSDSGVSRGSGAGDRQDI